MDNLSHGQLLFLLLLLQLLRLLPLLLLFLLPLLYSSLMHSSLPCPLATTVQSATSATPPLVCRFTRISDGSAWNPVPLMVSRTPPAADPAAATPSAGPWMALMLRTPRTRMAPLDEA